MKERIKISCSLWSANLAELGSSLKNVERYSDSFHFDIMDGHYVSNLLFGPDIIKALRPYTSKPFEIHLMVNHPEELIEQFIEVGGDVFIVHPETCMSVKKTIQLLKTNNKKVGLALRCENDCNSILEYLPMVDYIVIMGTEIGIKGVSIQPNTYQKIRFLSDIIREKNYCAELQIDGGIRFETVPKLYEHGAHIITAGSLLFNNDYEDIIKWLQCLSVQVV
jgi:ribulose-phosphate 3-epimerase